MRNDRLRIHKGRILGKLFRELLLKDGACYGVKDFHLGSALPWELEGCQCLCGLILEIDLGCTKIAGLELSTGLG